MREKVDEELPFRLIFFGRVGEGGRLSAIARHSRSFREQMCICFVARRRAAKQKLHREFPPVGEFARSAAFPRRARPAFAIARLSPDMRDAS